MVKLSKYELRKNAKALFLLLAGLAALEIWFLVSLHAQKENSLFGATVVLFLYAMVCFFAVFLFAVINYNSEINSKTSYLVFMTPVSPLGIILSKMLTVLVLGLCLGGLLVALGYWDITLISAHVEELREFQEQLMRMMRSFGFFSDRILLNLIVDIFIFLLAFFAQVAMVYFCITLIATLMQNSRFRVMVSAILYILLSWGRMRLQRLVTNWVGGQIGSTEAVFVPAGTETVEITAGVIFRELIPYTALNLATIVLLVGLTAWLLRRKLSL